ncbi:hypothetical protein Shyhy01_22910 [Streptomyces hygroscopicus subsp. hygroscopicus]|nr:hypothetical protein Shyhy01_22910 [Streptomyces hygroscopicus subsp. hygroscopicus]
MAPKNAQETRSPWAFLQEAGDARGEDDGRGGDDGDELGTVPAPVGTGAGTPAGRVGALQGGDCR